MRYELATNDQLWTIIKYDCDYCPLSLLRGAAIEMLNRNLFDKLIIDAILHVIKVDVIEKIYKLSMDDLMQIGRLEIFKRIRGFQTGKGQKLTSFIYMLVKHEMIKVLEGLGAKKRDSRKDISIQKKLEDGNDFEVYLYDRKTDVETYVINKLYLEELLKKVNKHQRKVLYYRLQGYEFGEISKILHRGSAASMSQAFRFAIEKMREGA
jgi:RNA polymerase sigma factor (sigma-70 family)